MRLLICAGGTAGGVNPALAVLQALGSEADPVLWVGGQAGMERNLVERHQVPYTEIPAAGIHGVGLRALPGNLLRLARGTLAARRILRDFQPDVMLFTGGYVAVPVALAGRNRPMLVTVPDIEPGLALKTLARFAAEITVSVGASQAYFSGRRVTVTGYPIRAELQSWTREQGRAHLNLAADRPVVLVYGGSKGARSINRALVAGLEKILPLAQVVHLSGTLDWAEVEAARKALPAELAQSYHAMPYLHEMGAALAAADLAVSRAGASTLGEYPYFGLPAILAPYPHAWRYQRTNAEYLVQRGAAELLRDEQMGAALVERISGLLANPARLAQMRAAMQALAQPQAAAAIADRVRALAAQKARATR